MPQTPISRRRFLAAAGVALGATTITCAGLTVAGMGVTDPSQPAIEMPDMTLGEKTMPERILVVYASQAGATAGVAEAIGRTLAERGLQVDVRPVAQVTDVGPYQAVVAGSAIHGSKWLPEAMDFLKKHRAALAQKPFAAFLVCMTLTMAKEEYRRGVTNFLMPVRDLVRPAIEGLFAGALDCSKIPGQFDRLILRGIVASGTWRQGDYRDWNAIRGWTERTAPLLLQ